MPLDDAPLAQSASEGNADAEMSVVYAYLESAHADRWLPNDVMTREVFVRLVMTHYSVSSLEHACRNVARLLALLRTDLPSSLDSDMVSWIAEAVEAEEAGRDAG